MYPPMELDDGKYYLKAMNCPHTHMIYKAEPNSEQAVEGESSETKPEDTPQEERDLQGIGDDFSCSIESEEVARRIIRVIGKFLNKAMESATEISSGIGNAATAVIKAVE